MAGNRMTARMFLAKEIRRAREATGKNGMSRASLAKGMFISESLIAKWENGTRVPNVEQIIKLIEKLNFRPDIVQRILEELVYEEVSPEWTGKWLSSEQSATELHSYELSVVNGLLQTPDYARAVLQYNRNTPIDLETRLQSRLERQRIFDQDEPPMAVFVFDEFVLRRQVGTKEVMFEQMLHLLELAKRPNIILQIVPSGTEYYAGCPFITAKLDGVEVAFLDDALTGRVIDDPGEVSALSRIWESIRAEARTQTESIELIERAVQSWQP